MRYLKQKKLFVLFVAFYTSKVGFKGEYKHCPVVFFSMLVTQMHFVSAF